MLHLIQLLCLAQISLFYYLCTQNINQLFNSDNMNTFGKHFAFTSFGESHGRAIGGILDGVPAGIKIDFSMIRNALDRRSGRDGSSLCTSARAHCEPDEIEWLSGVLDGVTLGTPIGFMIRNADAHSEDYEWLKQNYRVGHADFTYSRKYGIRDYRGGGRASARETASRVVAGSIARQLLALRGIHINARLIQVGKETRTEHFTEYLSTIRSKGDSIGGIVECEVKGLPVGVGEPIFDKLQSHLAYAMLSINGCKGFDYGSGFAGVGLSGSEMYLSADVSDIDKQRRISGGILGGISDGTPLYFRCVFKPTASNAQTFRAMHSTSEGGTNETAVPIGRHDVCIAVRAVSVVEAMTALTLMDDIEYITKIPTSIQDMDCT